jgi:hypothetical protein
MAGKLNFFKDFFFIRYALAATVRVSLTAFKRFQKTKNQEAQLLIFSYEFLIRELWKKFTGKLNFLMIFFILIFPGTLYNILSFNPENIFIKKAPIIGGFF